MEDRKGGCMIVRDELPSNLFIEVEERYLQTAYLSLWGNDKTEKYESSNAYAKNAELFTKKLMKLVNDGGHGFAHLTELEVFDNGKIEGLIILDAYEYIKAIGHSHPIEYIINSLLGDHGLVKIYDDGFGGPTAMKIRMWVEFRKSRSLGLIDVAMQNGWRF
jgi:hypothetical protein